MFRERKEIDSGGLEVSTLLSRNFLLCLSRGRLKLLSSFFFSCFKQGSDEREMALYIWLSLLISHLFLWVLAAGNIGVVLFFFCSTLTISGS